MGVDPLRNEANNHEKVSHGKDNKDNRDNNNGSEQR